MVYFARLILFVLISFGLHLLLIQVEISRHAENFASLASQGVSVVARSSREFLRQVEISSSVQPATTSSAEQMVAKAEKNSPPVVEPLLRDVRSREELVQKAVPKRPAVVKHVAEHKSQQPLSEQVSQKEVIHQAAVEPVSEPVLLAENIEAISGSSVLLGAEKSVGKLQQLAVSQQEAEPIIFEQAIPRYSLNPPPAYPDIARRRGQQGTVQLKVLVDADGSVGKLTVETSSGYKALDRAALKAVRFWQFKPALDYGLPVESWVIVPVDFILE